MAVNKDGTTRKKGSGRKKGAVSFVKIPLKELNALLRDTMDVVDDPKTIVVFNVNTEKWQRISVQSIIDIEQLTGVGAVNNKNKLQAGIEYLEQLELFFLRVQHV